jgi:hypothetical protein
VTAEQVGVEMVQPAHLWVPERAGSYGPEVLDLCRMAGLTFEVEQEAAIDALMSHDHKGRYLAPDAAVIEPRQNGKTNRIMVPMTLADLYLFPPDKIMHTAHRFRTTADTFQVMRAVIDGCFELRRRVKRILASQVQMSIELVNGATCDFLARTDMAGRGLGGRRVNLDEAFALQAGQLGALLPTSLARPDSQTLYASSAGKTDSSVLRELRARGRAGGDPDLIWVEWCAAGDWDDPPCELGKRCNHHRSTAGCALDREDLQRAANPLVRAGRIEMRSIRRLRKSMTPLEFGREILGWWDPEKIDETIPIALDLWDACADPHSRVAGPICLSFDVSPSRASAGIGLAGMTAAGVRHAELIAYRSGRPEWVVAELVRLKGRHRLMEILDGEGPKAKRVPAIVCDPAGPAATLLPALKAAGITPILMTARSMGAACGGLQDDVKAGPSVFVHLGQAQVDLAVEGAARRSVGDGGWAFARKRSAEMSVDICPVVAVAVARWALTSAAPPVALPRASWGG